MPTYEYEIITTGEIVEVRHGIKEPPLTETRSPKTGDLQPCKRLISVNQAGGFVLKGNGWTVKSSGFGKRGYKGKFQDQIRPSGTPVDAPANKSDADQQFQEWVDSDGLKGIKPSMDLKDKDHPARIKTTEEQLEK
jgi:predicted nucleic acid-binding Zn ribbon protein